MLITGSSGMIGSALRSDLSRRGHEAVCLVRRPPADSGEIEWNPADGKLDPKSIEGFDAVVNLAGENIMGRWTARKKASILASRLAPTRLLVQTFAQLNKPPEVFASASAIGYYGKPGRQEVTEESPAGDGFLADLCRQWESAAQAATQNHVRVVLLRFGMVLSRNGGGLRQMLTPFELCLGGRIGDGKQFCSWISITDTVGAIRHVIENQDFAGPVNIVSPNPVTNGEFTAALGSVLGRPTFLAQPAWLTRMIFGELADELLIPGMRVIPAKLIKSFTFADPQIEASLRRILFR